MLAIGPSRLPAVRERFGSMADQAIHLAHPVHYLVIGDGFCPGR
jgi:hypothetical protein